MLYQPIHRNPDNEEKRCQRVAICDLAGQTKLRHLLQAAFPLASPADPEPEKTIHWLVSNIDKGLTRIYAVSISECLNTRQHERLVERVSQQIGDPQVLSLFKDIVAAPAQSGDSSREPLALLLADITFEGIDQILQQARTLGREGNFLHVQCTRVGNQLVVLSDRDPRYEWIMPAV